MNLVVSVPLERIQNNQSINKLDLTRIDQYLTIEQKKRVAKFYREEAAKRTKYIIEPVWTMPDSVQLVEMDVLDVGTSPLNETVPELTVQGKSNTESDTLQITIKRLLKNNQGSYSNIKRNVLPRQGDSHRFGKISNTQLKKQIYKEKTQQIKTLKRQYQP